jgi:hypothetical protein
MAGRGIDRLRVAGGGPVALAIIGRAQMGAALQHLARNHDVGRAGIVAPAPIPTARVVRDAAGLLHRLREKLTIGIPVVRPFPYIADHVVQAEVVGRIASHRRCIEPAVLARILARKAALPCVGPVLAAGRQFVTPGIVLAIQPAARGQFPFGFRGKRLAPAPPGRSPARVDAASRRQRKSPTNSPSRRATPARPAW